MGTSAMTFSIAASTVAGSAPPARTTNATLSRSGTPAALAVSRVMRIELGTDADVTKMPPTV